MGVKPFEFSLYLRELGVIDHRREKQDGCAQTGKRNTHSVQGRGITCACRLLICGQIRKIAAG
jgi:hypothetical protein